MSIITIVEEVMALQINHTGKEHERMVYCDLIDNHICMFCLVSVDSLHGALKIYCSFQVSNRRLDFTSFLPQKPTKPVTSLKTVIYTL